MKKKKMESKRNKRRAFMVIWPFAIFFVDKGNRFGDKSHADFIAFCGAYTIPQTQLISSSHFLMPRLDTLVGKLHY